MLAYDRVKANANFDEGGTSGPLVDDTVDGYQGFSDVFTQLEQFTYAIVEEGGALWEAGIGHWENDGGSDRLIRDIVLDSSNSGALEDFPAVGCVVFNTYTARDQNLQTVSTNLFMYTTLRGGL